jgi:ubiquinol-cytochrome c reductase cytochrome b subunit
MGIIDKTTEFLEDRLGLPSMWRKFTDRKLPRGIGWMHTLGSATMFLLIVQVITGIFLAFYYVPSPEHAYESVYQITNQLAFGWLVRGIHKWAASLIVTFVVLHLLRVLYMGAYKYPRELTWVVGVLLLLVVMAFGFTGYLLPWDQKAYWATTVGTHIASFVPLVGKYFAEVLRGQADVGVRTLGRFYAFHTLFLPAFLFSLVAIHLAMVVKQGIAPLPVKKFASATREQYYKLYAEFKAKGRPFYESMTKDVIVSFLLLLLLFFLAWKLGAPLEEEADPTSVNYVPRPEWYFFFLFELLWWFPGKWIPVATFWIPSILILVLIFLPWLDRSIHRSPLRRPWTTGIATAILAMATFLTYKGATAPEPPTTTTEIRTRMEKEALTPEVLKGLTVYQEQSCAACHTIQGAGGASGPDLTRIGRKRDTTWLKTFIVDPTKFYPDSEMPPYDWLTNEELEALAKYLKQLK